MSFLRYQTIFPPHQTLPLNAILQKKKSSDASELAFSLHNHESLEIIVLLEGQLKVTIADRTYHLVPGDMVLSNPFDFHSGEWQNHDGNGAFIGYTMLLSKFLTFGRSPLDTSHDELIENRCQFDQFYPHGSSPFPTHIQKIFTAYHNKSSVHECQCLKLAYELLEELFANHYHAVENQHRLQRNETFLREVSAYVNANYTHDISTSDIAKALFMELSQFCHTFKRHYGSSFRSYLCQYRCIRAAELYKGHPISIAEIANAVGFSDYCHFSRSFKKYIGQSPSVYFGKWKK